MTHVMMALWGADPLPQGRPSFVSAMIAVAGPATALGGFYTSISVSPEPQVPHLCWGILMVPSWRRGEIALT